MDDVRALMDARRVGAGGAIGHVGGGPNVCAFSATHPLRASALIMHGSYPRRTKASGLSLWARRTGIPRPGSSRCDANGADRSASARAPSVAEDKRFSQWWARMLRMSATPAAAAILVAMNAEIDIQHILPATSASRHCCSTACRDAAINIGASRYMADRIPGRGSSNCRGGTTSFG